MFETLLVNVDGITLGIDVGTYLGSLDRSFDGYNYGKLECLLLGDSLGYIDDKVIGCGQVIKLGYTYGEVLITVLGNVYGITLGLDIRTDLGSLG